MRDILFRAKTIDSGIWVEGDLVHRTESDGLLTILIENNDFHDYRSYEVIPESLGQFTGLLDKSGKKIFEGDLGYSNNENYRIILKDLAGAYRVENIKNNEDNHFLLHVNKNIQIIGNVHDNPELIGKEVSNG